jgi:hypothetical protein
MHGPSAGAEDYAAGKVFVSYCHNDGKLIDRLGLLSFVSSLEQEGVSFWSDTRLSTGDIRDDKIRGELKHADIALLFVSQAYLLSPYCQRVDGA